MGSLGGLFGGESYTLVLRWVELDLGVIWFKMELGCVEVVCIFYIWVLGELLVSE